MSTYSPVRRKVVRAGIAVGAAVTAVIAVFVVQASAASASTSWSISPGSLKAWGSTNGDCVITWNVKDTRRDGLGAGIRFKVNDGTERYIDHYNFAGYGKTKSGAHDFRDDAAVAVKTFSTQGGKPTLFDVYWTQLC